MLRRILPLLSVALPVINLITVAEPPTAFIKKHCTDCHDSETMKGDFRADTLGPDLSNTQQVRDWSRILARLQSGEMPPANRTDRPSQSEIRGALTSLKAALHAESKRP